MLPQIAVQGGADEVEGRSHESSLFAGVREIAEGNAPDLFAGPAELMADGAGGVGGIVLEQTGLGAADLFGAEVEAEASAVGGQSAEFFGVGDLGALALAGQNQGLDEAGSGQFGLEAGGGELEGADAGDDFEGNASGLELLDRFVDGAVEAGVAIVEPDDPLARLEAIEHLG